MKSIDNYPHLFFKNCNRLRPSVCALCYLLLNHWTKYNQIWCVRYSHEWGVQRHFFGPAPWGPGEGSKGQISFNFNYSQFQRLLYQSLCVFSQMKDTKHIRRDFHSVARIMPQGWDFRALGVPRGVNFFSSNMVIWHIKPTGMANKRMQNNFYPKVKLVTFG